MTTTPDSTTPPPAVPPAPTVKWLDHARGCVVVLGWHRDHEMSPEALQAAEARIVRQWREDGVLSMAHPLEEFFLFDPQSGREVWRIRKGDFREERRTPQVDLYPPKKAKVPWWRQW